MVSIKVSINVIRRRLILSWPLGDGNLRRVARIVVPILFGPFLPLCLVLSHSFSFFFLRSCTTGRSEKIRSTLLPNDTRRGRMIFLRGIKVRGKLIVALYRSELLTRIATRNETSINTPRILVSVFGKDMGMSVAPQIGIVATLVAQICRGKSFSFFSFYASVLRI